jgi:two-component system sensor histidine kinase BarA
LIGDAMRLFEKIIPPASSFQRQLFLTMVVGLVLLALIASISTSWLASRNARQHLILQGKQVTENFARQSVLTLLYGSPDNSSDSAAATLAFPDVDYVSIIDLNGKTLLELGDANTHTWSPPLKPDTRGAVLGRESDISLDFYSPVYTHDTLDESVGSPFQASQPKPELLGTVLVVISKASLIKAQRNIFTDNISLSLTFAIALLVFLRLLVKRITTPLQNLSTVMTLADQQGDAQIRAEVRGPSEITHMAQSFNKMMETLEERDLRLRRHRDMLETEVALRTQELVQARDEAVRASKHKSEFLANMSHELRTPMNAIIGYTEMVIEDLEAEGNKDAVSDLKRVKNASRHLLSLINSVLDLSKIEAGRMDLWIETVSINELLNQVRDSVEPMIMKNNNNFEIKKSLSQKTLDIDPGKLRQILLNLLSNAAKFTENGQIHMDVRLNKSKLVIAVKDTGIGIPENMQEQIFEAFRQLDMSTTRGYGGTGLGLGISQRYCQLMGGKITVKSKEGEGSVFTVTIPLPIKDVGDSEVGHLSETVEQPQPQTVRASATTEIQSILIVDDDEDFIDIQTRALQQLGYDVHTVTGAKDLVDEVIKIRPAVVILDILLKPPNDGWTVLARLKNDDVLKEIPVIVVSVIDERARAMDMGAEEFLSKPVDRAELLVVLQDIQRHDKATEAVTLTEDG